MRKSLRQILVAALVLTFICGAVFANVATVRVEVNVFDQNLPPLEMQGARINWAEGVIEALGEGYAPDSVDANSNRGQSLARRAAILDAQRQLLETIKGVNVTSTSTVDMMQLTDDSIRTSVSGMVRGASVEKNYPKSGPGGGYAVLMQIKMYGPDGLAGVVLKPAQIQPIPQPEPGYRPASNYTGLVIVVGQNMGLKGAFSPRVYNERGDIIYGDKFIDPNQVISTGMVEYRTLNDVNRGNSRAGNNPLIVNATKVADHNFNVVISNADAQMVLAAQAQSGFMQKCAVVFARN